MWQPIISLFPFKKPKSAGVIVPLPAQQGKLKVRCRYFLLFTAIPAAGGH